MGFFSFFSPKHTKPEMQCERDRIIAHYGGLAEARGIQIRFIPEENNITVTRGNQKFILAAEHYLYAVDFSNQFDYYFSSVEPIEKDGFQIQDFSQPSWHVMRDGGEKMFFTSMAEDSGATKDYIKYLAPKEGDIVLDVGAYCGLSARAFSRAVGPGGMVLAFEPDPRNYKALDLNLKDFSNIKIIDKAVAGKKGSVLFSSEGNMGAAIVAVETERGKTIEVESITLQDAVEKYARGRVDVIKLDIEGAEYGVIDSCTDFFQSHRPRWAVELHPDPVTSSPIDVDRVRLAFDRNDYMTLLQESSEIAAMPTIFAWPRQKQQL